MNRLLVDDFEVELEEQKIGIVFQKNTIGELENRQVDYTTSFEILLTEKNKVIFANIQQLQSASKIPYRYGRCSLLVSGVLVISDGVLEVETATEAKIEVSCYSQEKNILDKLEGLTLKDLDYSDMAHVWNVNTLADNYNDETKGWVYPLLQTEPQDISDDFWSVRNQSPSIYVHRILSKICKVFNYNFNYTNLADKRFENLVLVCTEAFERDKAWIDRRKVFAGYEEGTLQPEFYLTGSFTPDFSKLEQFIQRYGGFCVIGFNFSANMSYRKMNFTRVSEFPEGRYIPNKFYAPSGTYDLSNSDYVAISAIDIQVRLSLRYNVRHSGIVDTRYKVFLVKNGSVIHLLHDVEHLARAEVITTIDSPIVSLNVGDTLSLYHEYYKTAGFMASDLYLYTSGTHVEYIPQKTIAVNSEIEINNLISPTPLVDFFKSILKLFNATLFFDYRKKEVEMVFFKTIAKDKAVDISSKVDVSRGYQLSYKESGYAKLNEMKYNKDDDRLGYSSFEIFNETLEEKKVVVEVPYASAKTGEVLTSRIKTAFVPLVEPDGAGFKRKSADPTLLVIDRREAYNLTIIDQVNSNRTLTAVAYPRAFFSELGQLGIGFEELKNNYYLETIFVLQNFKKIKLYLNLDIFDIQNLINNDTTIEKICFRRPVYIDFLNATFYVNKIEEFTGEGSVLTELIRL